MDIWDQWDGIAAVAELADAQVSKTCGGIPIMWVRFPPAALGPLAHLVERTLRMGKVAGSIPARSTRECMMYRV